MKISYIQDQILGTLMGLSIISLLQSKQQFLFYDILGGQILNLLAGVFLGMSVILFYVFNRYKRSQLSFFIIAAALILIFPLTKFIGYGGFPIGVVAALVLIYMHCLIAISLKKNSIYILLFPYYVFTIYVVYKLLNVVDPNLVFINSKNWISYYALLLLAPYYIITSIRKYRPNILPALITVALSIYSTSRSGILSSVLVLLPVVYILYGKRYFHSFVVTTTLFLLIYWEEIYNLIQLVDINGSRFSSINVLEDGRIGIITDYIKQLDFGNFMVGPPESFMWFSSLATRNPHNSFLNAAIGAGVPYALIFIFITIYTIYIYRKNLPFIVIYIGTVFRIFTDSGSLLTTFDTFLFLPLVIHYLHRKTVKMYHY
jgi:hypothetical protein